MKLFALLATVFSFAVFAEEAAPAASAPKHSCTAPEVPGKMASDNQMKNFNKKFKEYGECIKKFIADQEVQVKLHTEAGNAAINEYNGYVKKMNEERGTN